MSELFIVLFVSLIVIGWGLIWLHDNSLNLFWYNKPWWSVLGVFSVSIGVFGTIISVGAICGGVL